MVVHPELSQLLHDAGPMLGRIWVVELYSSHGTQHAAPEIGYNADSAVENFPTGPQAIAGNSV
jgi:hypothetical protein